MRAQHDRRWGAGALTFAQFAEAAISDCGGIDAKIVQSNNAQSGRNPTRMNEEPRD
jgi:hypothetical protein